MELIFFFIRKTNRNLKTRRNDNIKLKRVNPNLARRVLENNRIELLLIQIMTISLYTNTDFSNKILFNRLFF